MPRPLSTRTPEEILAKRRAYRKAYYAKNRLKIREYYKHYSKGLGSKVRINPRVCDKCGSRKSDEVPSKLQIEVGSFSVDFN